MRNVHRLGLGGWKWVRLKQLIFSSLTCCMLQTILFVNTLYNVQYSGLRFLHWVLYEYVTNYSVCKYLVQYSGLRFLHWVLYVTNYSVREYLVQYSGLRFLHWVLYLLQTILFVNTLYYTRTLEFWGNFINAFSIVNVADKKILD